MVSTGKVTIGPKRDSIRILFAGMSLIVFARQKYCSEWAGSTTTPGTVAVGMTVQYSLL